MTIGELKQILANIEDKSKCVKFNFCNCIPTTIDSWRGVYAEPALGWTPTGYSIRNFKSDLADLCSVYKSETKQCITVQELIVELEHGTSEMYSGWKGGEYYYYDHSPLHIDNPGDCTHTEIASVEVGKHSVIIHTKKKDYL